jgi:type IV pilus assembly protein PilO
MLSRLSSRYIAFGVVALSLVFAAAWYFLIYQPGLANAQIIRDEVSKLEEQKAVGERARANIAQLCGVVGNLRVQQTAFLRALPRTEDISTLLNELRGTIQGNSAQLNSVSRSAGAASTVPLPAGVRPISINLGVEGTFGSFYGVLAAVEALQRFSKVETVSLGLSSQGDSFNPKLNAQMAMTTFVYDNPNRDNLQSQVENPLCQSAPSTTGAPR